MNKNTIIILLILTNIVLLGGNLNLIAVKDNGGRMPFLMTDFKEIKNPYLTDFMTIPGYMMISIGDIFIVISGFFMIVLVTYNAVLDFIQWRHQHEHIRKNNI